MHPSRLYCLWALCAALLWALWAPQSRADKFTITSTPAGAAVEIDGVAVGATPYHTQFPGGYFHKTHTVFGSRLDHAIVLRISKDGYGAQQINLTEGPFEWIAVTGRHQGSYFLLKSSHFDIHLDPGSEAKRNVADAPSRLGVVRPASAAPLQSGQDKATDATGAVAIESDPPGADIYVDHDFVGQTPSTLRLAGGLHRVELKAAGRQIWSRNLDVTTGSQITLQASLIPANPADLPASAEKSP